MEKTWPNKYESETELTFSGSFEEKRIFYERLNTISGYFERGILWAIFILGMTMLAWQSQNAWANKNYLFVFQKNFKNLVFWISLYTTTYLWARQKYYGLKKTNTSLLKTKNAKKLDIYDFFSKPTKKIWLSAFDLAKKENSWVNFSYILRSICLSREGKIAFLRLNTNAQEILEFLENFSKLQGDNPEKELFDIPFLAREIAISCQNKQIEPIILLCALVKALPQNHILQDIFFNLNITWEKLSILSNWLSHISLLREDLKLFKQLAKFKPAGEINRGLTSLPTPYLDRFSQDLTSRARASALPLALGRAADLEQIFALLEDGGKNLIIKGQEGSGRTTLVNELAYKMASEQVPPMLSDKRLIALEISAILGSGQKAENVFVNCLNESAMSGNIVLLIEDLHTLSKTQSQTGFNFLELLINFLEQTPLEVLGTTTIEAYTEILENTANFSNVFNSYELLKLSSEQITLACCVKATLLEHHNNCVFTLEAILEAIRLSDVFFQNLGQPQKSIGILVEASAKVKNSQNKIITKTTIEKIVSAKTHVPAEALEENEGEKLLNLENEMQKYIVGQTTAVSAVCEGLRRARSGLGSTSRPLSSFLFLGPTGVGKTEVAKTLAKIYFGEEKLLLRLDMSEYQGELGLEKFLGGNDKKSGSIISHLKNYPFCLLLLDEFEKASLEIHNLFLQILDDGRLTTHTGETLDLTHCLIIATSNAGSLEIQEAIKMGLNQNQIKSQLLNVTLPKYFAPELVNRFDDVIYFESLNFKQVQQIAILQLQYLKQILLEKGVKMEIGQSVLSDIAQNAFDPSFGARPIRRYIQDHIEGYIAKLLLAKKLKRGSEIFLEIENGELKIK